MKEDKILKELNFWFIIHFAADVLVALPMMFAPEWLLGQLGWYTVDPVASRICAAALFGIGIESLLGRKSDLKTFTAMLNLKLIWSLAAVFGFCLSLIENTHGNPPGLWVFLIIFILFHFLWLYYRLQIRKISL